MQGEPLEPRPVQLGTGSLGLSEVVRVARGGAAVEPLGPETTARLEETASWVAQTVDGILSEREPGRRATAFYGINTGFGALAGRTALDNAYLIKALGRNLIASHTVGVGRWFDLPVVRAAMLIRAQSLAKGYSGVRPLIVDTLRRMLNARVYPAVPEQGSLGASGDLAPLAHLVLAMSAPPRAEAGADDLGQDATDGEAFLPFGEVTGAAGAVMHLTEDHVTGEQTLWRRAAGAEAMASVGGKIELEAKEALALANGSTFSAAIGALALCDARNLLDHAALVVAMTLEGIRGFRDPFLPQLHRVRGHAAAGRFAAEVLSYVEGSELLDPGDLDVNPRRVPPQDPYSIRCAPQVHGSIADTLELVQRWVEMDINAVTDNPLIFLDLPRSYKTISGGNFHGEPIALAMDFLAIVLTEMGSMSDRRMFVMNDYHPAKIYEAGEDGPRAAHGLPSFLIDPPDGLEGLNTGLMMLQATAAALVSDCKVLAHPDSVDSIPSSGNQEDHVSMSLNAARHARDVVANIEQVLALEFVCAAQAIHLQRAKTADRAPRLGAGTGAAYAVLRGAGVAPLTQDRAQFPDIRRVVALLRRGALVEAARRATAASGASGGVHAC